MKRKKTTEKKPARKAVKRRTDLERPFNGSTWTRARMKRFIMSALRGARWPQRYEAVKRAFIRHGTNPATGKKCKLHQCEHCHDLYPQNGVQADHIIPVIGPEGFINWDTVVTRMFCEQDGYQILCKSCHLKVTAEERKERESRTKDQ